MLFNLSSKKEKQVKGKSPPSDLITKGHTYNQEIVDLIRRRRLQIMVHSSIYYVYDENIISDSTWMKWACELVELQNKYPEESKIVIHYDMFKEWDGESGYYFSENDWALKTAKTLLKDKFGDNYVPEGGWLT